jgi:aquaporin TIP
MAAFRSAVDNARKTSARGLAGCIPRSVHPVPYWFAQLTGVIVAALLLTAVLPQQATDAVDLGAPQLAGGGGAGRGLVIELILTFFLVWVIFATAADPRGAFASIAGLAIGFTITLDIFMGGP